MFMSSLLWDVFIINSVEPLQALSKTHSEIDINPFLKTQKPSSSLFYLTINSVEQLHRLEEGFVFLEIGLYRSRIEFLVVFEVVQHCL